MSKEPLTIADDVVVDMVYVLRSQAGRLLRNPTAAIEPTFSYTSWDAAFATGFHRLSDVAQMAGIARSNISKYLSVLRELGYVERQVTATARRPEKSRKGRYTITDPYLRFYFRFLAPNLL